MSTQVAPLPQHLQALAHANAVRMARGQLRRRITCGEVGAADVIADRPPEADTMTITDLLLAQHNWGTQRTRRFLAALELPEAKLCGSFTDRQRKILVAALWDANGVTKRKSIARAA